MSFSPLISPYHAEEEIASEKRAMNMGILRRLRT
jgi:hypothetical protein